MASFADPQDVADIWRPLSAAEAVTASVLLGQLSASIRLRLSDIDTRVAASSDLATVIRGHVAGAVRRVMTNPDGKVQESIDDYTYRRADAVADGVLYLTATEWSDISPTGTSGAAFTITPFGEPGYATAPLNAWELNL